jgi:hypothetical protein
MRPSHVLLLLLSSAAAIGCKPSRPVIYTSDAIFTATCSAMAGAKRLGTTPAKLRVVVDTEAAVAGPNAVRSGVTPVAGRADGASAHTGRIEVDIDPATVNCEIKDPAPRMWLNSDTGELTMSPP